MTPLPPLVDGRRLMRGLGIGPSPLVGRLLEEIRAAQEDGEIRTEREALALAARRVDERAEKRRSG